MKQVVRKHIAEKYNIENEQPIYTLVVDGNSLLKTSLVSYKENEDGKDFSAILTFFGIIRKILAMRDFSKCFVFGMDIIVELCVIEYIQNINKTENIKSLLMTQQCQIMIKK